MVEQIELIVLPIEETIDPSLLLEQHDNRVPGNTSPGIKS